MAPRNTRNGASARAGQTAQPSRAAHPKNKGRVLAFPGSSARSAGTAAPRPTSSPGPAKRKPTRAPRPGWVAPVLALAVIVAFAVAYYPVAAVQYRETRSRADLKNQLAAIRSDNDAFEKKVDRLTTPEGVEDFARTELGLVRPGEHSVIVMKDGEVLAPDTEDRPVTQTSAGEIPGETSHDPSKDRGGWTGFLDVVFDNQ